MKTIGIVAFLEWAFNEELPKGGGGEGLASRHSAWGKIMQFSELGVKVDTFAHHGVMEFIERNADPHPDAVLAGEAVKALADVSMDLPDTWDPLPGVKRTPAVVKAIEEAVHMMRGDHAEGKALRMLPVGIVVRCAVLRRWPDFAGQIEVKERMVLNGAKPAWFVRRKGVDAFGHEVEFEVDGYNPKTGKPLPGAYRKWEMSPEAVSDIAGRAEWQLWRAAVDMVFEDLNGRLNDHVLEPCTLSLEPWVDGLPAQKERRILPARGARAGFNRAIAL